MDPKFLKETADYIQKSAPVIEKAASDQHLLETIAPELVDNLISVGVCDASKRADAIAHFTEGGVSKIANVAIRLSRMINPEPIGTPDAGANSKQASANGGGRRNAVQSVHDAFADGIMND